MQRIENDLALPSPKRQKLADHVVIDMPHPESKLQQRYLLRLINIYLVMRAANLEINKIHPAVFEYQVSEIGYCHGLTLAWAAKMADYREDDLFYDVKRQLAACPYACQPSQSLSEEIQSLRDAFIGDASFFRSFVDWFHRNETKVEKFLALIEWGQNSSIYTTTPDKSAAHLISQSAVHRLLGIEEKYYQVHDGAYTAGQLKQFLLDLPNETGRFFVVTGGGVKLIVQREGRQEQQPCMHTIGIFMRDNRCYYYDANFTDGRAKLCENSQQLFERLQYSLYSSMNSMVPDIYRLQIKEIFFPYVERKAIISTQPLRIVIKKSRLPSLPAALSNTENQTSNSMISHFFRKSLSFFGIKLSVENHEVCEDRYDPESQEKNQPVKEKFKLD